jgi:cytidylate kinase
MAIITISRELAALGDETARKLTELLQYRFVDKKDLEERMKSLGAVEQKIVKYDERKPSFWASLSQDRDDYLHYLKVALFSEAAQGNCIFMGRGCAAMLRDVPGVISVCLSAPMEIRLERAKSFFHCDERRARHIIDQSDRNREGFFHYFFETGWKNPEHYHLALNTGLLHPDLCAALVKTALDKNVTAEAEAQGLLRIEEMKLGQQLVHHLLYNKSLPIHFLETKVQSGTVTLFGVANSQALVEAAVAGAKEISGVNSVKSEIQVIQVVQEYSVVQ